MGTFPRLSVLDVVAIGPGVDATQALQWTTDIAQAAERLGYYRLWVAEHHAVADIGSSAPAVLIAHLAARTTRLRLGSGGVMLPNHAPLVIAEQFAILHALHPGRIDLGVGRARGADPVTVLALGRASNSSEPDTFADQLDELNGFLDGGLPNGHPYAAVKVSPTAEPPPIFLLSSSAASAELAAVRGLPLAFAHHLAPEATATALAAYRTAFRPGPALKEPYAIVTVGVVCAESQDDAERAAIAASAIRARRVLASRQGRTPTTDELVSPQLTEQEALLIADILAAGRILVGTPDTVHAAMVELSRRTTADEVMVCTIEYDGPARIRTLTAAARNAN